jgi:Interferon-induced transmembrane protein
MADTVTALPPSYSSATGMWTNEIDEKVAQEKPQPSRSSLNYAFDTDEVQYEAQSELKNNADTAVSLANASLDGIRSTEWVKTHEAWSFFNIFCCQICLGGIALHFSRKTKYLSRHGDTQGAIKASKRAKNINIAATVIGIVIILLHLLGFISSQYISRA